MSHKLPHNQNVILTAVVSRSPNAVALDTIERRFKELSSEDVDDALSVLVAKRIIKVTENTNSISGSMRKLIELTEPYNYPIRKFIRIDSEDFNRNMTGDLVIAEDVNEPLEALSEYMLELEKRFVQLSNEQTQRYWANTITLFGLFLAVFTLIVSSIPKLNIDPSWSFEQVIAPTSASIIPQFAVLLVFVLLLWIIFGRR
jgi:hypothetical protein